MGAVAAAVQVMGMLVDTGLTMKHGLGQLRAPVLGMGRLWPLGFAVCLDQSGVYPPLPHKCRKTLACRHQWPIQALSVVAQPVLHGHVCEASFLEPCADAKKLINLIQGPGCFEARIAPPPPQKIAFARYTFSLSFPD